MRFLSEDIGQEIMREIQDAAGVDIASAYFAPGDDQIEVLQEVPKLRIYISEDFSISDPFGLESLATDVDAIVRCIGPEEGRFHAKVVLCDRQDGSIVAFVGSANFTGAGLFSNQETCIRLDTQEGDGSAIQDVTSWIEGLRSISAPPNWIKAKRRHENSKTAATPSESQEDATGSRESTDYWILKTRSGQALKNPSEADKVDYWDDFRSEGVVAIGWTELRFNPLGRSRAEIRKELDEVGKKPSSAHVIDKFVNGITTGDLILLCRGFPENSSSDVLFYGYARVEGDFYYDRDSSWWYMKYPVTMQEAEVMLPKEVFVESFDKESLIGTIHKKGITEDRFFNFRDRVENEFGVPFRL